LLAVSFSLIFNINGYAGKQGLGVCLWAFEGEAEAVEQLLARHTGLYLNFLNVRAHAARTALANGTQNIGPTESHTQN